MKDSHSDAYESDVSGNVIDSQAERYTSEGKLSNKGKKKASDVWNYSVNMHALLGRVKVTANIAVTEYRPEAEHYLYTRVSLKEKKNFSSSEIHVNIFNI